MTILNTLEIKGKRILSPSNSQRSKIFLKNSEEDNKNPSHSYEYDLVESEGRNIIIDLMLEEDGITNEQLADNPDLKEDYFEKADFEMRNNGYKIYSTLDPTLHRAIQQRVTETQDQFGSTQTMS